MLAAIRRINLIPAAQGEVKVEVQMFDSDTGEKATLIVDVTEQFNEINRQHREWGE